MQYKIVNVDTGKELSQRYSNIDLAVQTIFSKMDDTKHLIAVPAHWEYLHSMRHNDYRWMEHPYYKEGK